MTEFSRFNPNVPARSSAPRSSARFADSVPVDPERQLASLMQAEAENRKQREQSEFWRESLMKRMLREAGLRPTRQRLALASLLFGREDRHLTAEMIHDEAVQENLQVSLATVYNTLHQFASAGLVRTIGVEGTRLFFDTNPSVHNHFVVEGGDALFDVPEEDLVIRQLPPAPDGFTITGVDMIVRLRRVGGRADVP